MSLVQYDDLFKSIADLEIDNTRLRIEKGDSIDIFSLSRRIEQLKIENNSLKHKTDNTFTDSNNTPIDDANKKVIEINSIESNNTSNSNSTNESKNTYVNKIFEFYEVNGDMSALASAAKRCTENDITFPTCYITPIVTWDYRHPNNQSSGIDCIADFSFPSGTFIDVASSSTSSLLSGPQYDRYHISQFLDADGVVSCHASFLTIRVVEPWPDDHDTVKYIIHLANRTKAGKRIKRFLAKMVRLKKEREFMGDIYSPGGTKIDDNDNNTDTNSKSIFRYFKRTPKKDDNNNRFQLFKSPSKNVESAECNDNKSSLGNNDNSKCNNDNDSTSNTTNTVNSITEPSENIKRIAKALRRAIQLGVPAESPAISQSMIILRDANALHLLTASDTCHIYFDDDDNVNVKSTNKKNHDPVPPPKPPRQKSITDSNSDSNIVISTCTNDSITDTTKGKVFIRDKCYCAISQEANHSIILCALQAIADAERHTNTNDRCDFLSYIYNNITDNDNDNNKTNNYPKTIDNYLRFFSIPSTLPCSSTDSVMAVMLSIIESRVILKIMNLLLLEKSIIIIGTNPGVVSSITLGISMLIAPLKWSGAMLPLVPNCGKELFGAPVPFILGTTATTLTMDDINLNTAVLNIFDPILDRNSKETKSKKSEDARLSKNNHTEAWFTRVPELQSTMPTCELLDQQLRSYRRSLILSKIERRRATNNENANEYLFDLCFFYSMLPGEIKAVRQMTDAIRQHNVKYIGSLAQPSSWKSCVSYNPKTQQTEFNPATFMRPIKDIVEFQEQICQTQIFVDYFTKIRNDYDRHSQQRLFICDFLYFKYFHKKNPRIRTIPKAKLNDDYLLSIENSDRGSVKYEALLLLMNGGDSKK